LVGSRPAGEYFAITKCFNAKVSGVLLCLKEAKGAKDPHGKIAGRWLNRWGSGNL
jgi:hypothetical protein